MGLQNSLLKPLAIILCLLAGLAYVWLIEPERIEVSHHVVGAGPGSDRPIRVVQLSDLHMRAIGSRERAVAAEVVRVNPDLIVLSGDVIDRADALDVLDVFLALLPGVPTLAVLGNWEHWSGADLAALRSTYQAKHAAQLLINAHADYTFGSRTLRVLGLDDFTAGQPDSRLLAQPHAGLLLLVQHSPGWFDRPEVASLQTKASLCLSGHTHGGQVALFGWAPWTPRGSGAYTAGLYDLPMCPLYVSRGIGTSILPIRLGARPEIAVFTF